MGIKHAHICEHSTRLDEADLELAMSIPMAKNTSNKLKYILDKTGVEIEESKKYHLVAMLFLVLNISGLITGHIILTLIGLAGVFIMYGFAWYTTKNINRQMGFADGILFSQAEFARGLKEFEDDVHSGKKEVPQEVKDALTKFRSDTIKE